MRKLGWEQALNNFVEDRRHLPFAWGQNDCCLFALNAAQAITDVILLPSKIPYKTRSGGLSTITKWGGTNLLEAGRNYLNSIGLVEKSIKFCRRGDLVICANSDCEFGYSFAICLGANIVIPGKDGLVFLPTSGFCWGVE